MSQDARSFLNSALATIRTIITDETRLKVFLARTSQASTPEGRANPLTPEEIAIGNSLATGGSNSVEARKEQIAQQLATQLTPTFFVAVARIASNEELNLLLRFMKTADLGRLIQGIPPDAWRTIRARINNSTLERVRGVVGSTDKASVRAFLDDMLRRIQQVASLTQQGQTYRDDLRRGAVVNASLGEQTLNDLTAAKKALAEFLGTITPAFFAALVEVATDEELNQFLLHVEPTVGLNLLASLGHVVQDQIRSRLWSQTWGRLKDARTNDAGRIRRDLGKMTHQDFQDDLDSLEFTRRKLSQVLQVLADDVRQNKPPETLRWVSYAVLAWVQEYENWGGTLLHQCKKQDFSIPGTREKCAEVKRIVNLNMGRSVLARVRQLIPNVLETLKPEWKAELLFLQQLEQESSGPVVLELPKEGAMETVPGLNVTVENQNVFKLF